MAKYYWVRRKRPVWVATLVTIGGLTVIMLVQSIPNRHSIEDNLTQRSVAALDSAGVPGVKVKFVGRDGTLDVPKQADVDKAQAVVEALEGVRVVSAHGPGALRNPTLTVTLLNGKVSLTGVVSSESVHSQLASALGSKLDRDQLSVDGGVADTGILGIPAVITALGDSTKDVRIELRDGKMTLTGKVETLAIRDAALAAAANAVGKPNVVNVLELPPPVVQRQLTDLPQITFEDGSATLTPAGRDAVGVAAAILKDNPTAKISIEGHTDSNGSTESNQLLSEQRARTVLEALVSMGISADRLTSTGYGESRPRVPDTSPENQALNRRVEFIVK